jgi:hypothetical protein
MGHEPRQIAFLGREGRVKHYGIALEGDPRRDLAVGVRRKGRESVPAGAYGFTIAHDARFAALAIVYWWENENELHARYFTAPIDDPGELEEVTGTGMACVWELEVIDFERRAWLEDVLIGDDPAAYLARALEPVAV